MKQLTIDRDQQGAGYNSNILVINISILGRNTGIFGREGELLHQIIIFKFDTELFIII